MEKKENNRRKFLQWGAAAGIVAIASRFGNFFSSSEKAEPVKMLTQDGRLVEVNIAAIKKGNKKATNKDLQEWIKR